MTTTTSIDRASLETLRNQLCGSVLTPGDARYEAATLTWDAVTFAQRPAVVVLPERSDDVRLAVEFAQAHGLPIGVQGGGHGHPLPANDALLVNFSRMKGIAIDPQAATARVEAGVLWSELLPLAHKHGLAAASGFAGTVGVIGYLLGGGLGWLARQYGFGAASVRSLDVVTADGRMLRVNELTHPDLFWGLRGGGGNFGIVTAVEIGLYPVSHVFAGQVVYPIEQARDVLRTYLEWTRTVPNALTSALRVTHYPAVPSIPSLLRGKSVVTVLGCYNGSQGDGEAWFRPLRVLGAPLLDTFAHIPYPDAANITNEPLEGPPLPLHSASNALDEVSFGDIDALLQIAGSPASGIFSVEMRHLGGALKRDSDNTMAASASHIAFIVQAFAVALTPALFETGKQSIRRLMSALRSAASGQTQYNWLRYNDVGPERTRAAFTPEQYQRLVALKQAYDPHNIFCFNNNIPPTL